jgi:uncharacterized membrane protein YeaQ/YmgE (transglycosylase-associated protein family)
MTEVLSHWVNELFVWIGFGAIVGLLSKAILPGKDPGGTFATVFIGILGSFIGAATYFFFSGERISPISIIGFLVAVAGSALLLVTFRILSGRFFPRGFSKTFSTRRHRHRVIVDE